MSGGDTWRARSATGLAVLVCAFHFSSFGPASRPLVTDVRFFVYLAGEVAGGAVPHRDYFENKPQLATFAGALLHRAGEAAGADPLIAIRVGYLTLAALGGLAAFSIFRRIGGGAVAGGLGLLAYCTFGLLGVLPAVGNVPKLLMALGGAAAALLLHRRRWFWAGVAGAAAFMDWQIGALVAVAALATAGLHGSPRGRAFGSVAAGIGAGLAPFFVYFGLHGALDEAWRQVIGATLFRGEAALLHGGLMERLARIARVAELGCPAQLWLFWLGLAGLPVALCWAWIWRRDERALLLHPLLVYHVGVLGFSLVDFQYYGDLFLLLHSVAFFLGVGWVSLHGLASRVAREGRRQIVAALALLLALALARPGGLRPHLDLLTPIGPHVTLADQRQVAAAVSARVGAGTVAFLEHSELLALMGRRNALPLVYWNLPAWHYYRSGPDEPFAGTCARLLLGADADAVVPPRALGYDAVLRDGYAIERFASAGDRYVVDIALRTVAGEPDAGPDF